MNTKCSPNGGKFGAVSDKLRSNGFAQRERRLEVYLDGAVFILDDVAAPSLVRHDAWSLDNDGRPQPEGPAAALAVAGDAPLNRAVAAFASAIVGAARPASLSTATRSVGCDKRPINI